MGTQDLILALRRLNLFRGQSFINISGLALGLLVFLVISSVVQSELKTDQMNTNYSRIYTVGIAKGNAFYTPAILGETLKDKFSDIEAVVRVDLSLGEITILRNGENPPVRSKIAYVDSSFVRVFSLKSIYGDLDHALDQPYSLILTKTEALKIFGTTDVAGKLLKFMGGSNYFTVTGIIEDPPKNSLMTYTGLASFQSINAIHPYTLNCGWNCWNVNTFIMLKEGRDANELVKQIEKELAPILKEQRIEKVRLVSMKDVYFGTSEFSEFNQGNMRNVEILSLVGILILIMALINYVNLATSRASTRSKEVGLRKVIGASRSRLVYQFIIESVVLSFLALNLAIILYNILNPWLNNFLGLSLPSYYMNRGYQWIYFLAATVILGLIAGVYPAFYLTSYNPLHCLKKEMLTGEKGVIIRKSLITAQFFISLVLIMATLIIYLQTRFILNKDLGFDKEQLVTVNLPFGVPFNHEAFKQRVSEIPVIKEMYYSFSYPGNPVDQWAAPVLYNGDRKQQVYYAEQVEPGYLEMMGMQLTEGRYFSKDLATDEGCVIINETAARNFDLKKPLQARFPGFKDTAGYVLGVVKDFYFEDLHKKIKPIVFYCNKHDFGLANIKLYPSDGEQTRKTMDAIHQAWTSVNSELPFDVHFLDDLLNALYHNEQKYKRIFSLFSMIVIFVACMGLFGLASFTIDQRTKEIGIRKVNGAGTFTIISSLAGEYFVLIVIAFVLAVPLAWYELMHWLNTFAYRIQMPWWIFPAAGLLVTMIAIFTVSYQSWKVSRMNPVESLRYE